MDITSDKYGGINPPPAPTEGPSRYRRRNIERKDYTETNHDDVYNQLLVHTLVMVRLDYCNALLCGAREDVIRQLERLQRQAARVVCKKYKNDHTSVTELMWGLHWLPIRARIQYKILLLVYKAFTNGSPTYLADMMTSCNPVRSTRSSHKVNLLVVPHQKSNKYSEKAFAVVGPRLWNELLTDELRGCNSVDTFKKKLKTMLFKKHY